MKKDNPKVEEMKRGMAIIFSPYTLFTTQGMKLSVAGLEMARKCLKEYGIQII